MTPAFIIDSVRHDLNPEVVGWCIFLTYILPLLPISGSEHLGLVVDSELDQHALINQRKQPYYHEYYLPPNVSLIYASSDTGSDIPNQLIKKCDKAARDMFTNIKSGILKFPPCEVAKSPDYSQYTIVNIKGSPYIFTKISHL